MVRNVHINMCTILNGYEVVTSKNLEDKYYLIYVE